jgi:hypothetical protein
MFFILSGEPEFGYRLGVPNIQQKGTAMSPGQPNSIGMQSLAQEAERLIEQARSVAGDREREVLVRRARQLDVLSHLNGKLSSTE